MTDCVFCNIIAINCKETEAYLLTEAESQAPVPPTNYYFRFNNVAKPTINESDITTFAALTPGARLTLKITEINELLKHKYVWESFLKTDTHHCIIFNNLNTAIDNSLPKKLELKQLAKDWDICLISDTEYIFTKRAARILLGSSKQFNTDLKNYLLSFSVLAVFKLD